MRSRSRGRQGLPDRGPRWRWVRTPAWAAVAVGLGVTELSMGAESVLEVRAAVAELDVADCRRAAQRALDAPDADGARTIAGELVP